MSYDAVTVNALVEVKYVMAKSRRLDFKWILLPEVRFTSQLNTLQPQRITFYKGVYSNRLHSIAHENIDY